MVNESAAALFDDWDEALIWSCLQGYMGTMIVNDESNPEAAIIDIGDFCFCAGMPNANLLRSICGSKLLIPKDEPWQTMIERYFNKKAKKLLRYAIKKEPDVFDKIKLNTYIESLDNCYELRLFDKQIFQLAQSESWSADLCSQFKNYSHYQKCAVGVAILNDGKLVAGASPYAVYQNGIEIEIDTKPEYRCKGLATVCGAKLILECLSRNIYPSWDAHDLRSVHLAEKLGYHLSHPYVTYELMNV
ncbi:GNAT family N-acetyltransferase [Oscillibacter sp.]|uniref:GNAT family N-acetyltransferase n=1 Tax=Oscillibacter sp. TaxID=1945593 RepID=UPI0028AB59CE|nr:GNAT family N-acetyltransferase [Oscillibacter sp.]